MNKTSKIYIAGHRGLVGSALRRNLEKKGFTNLIFKTHAELDLTNQIEVDRFFKEETPEYVFLAAAKVGGIHANNVYRAEFIYENLQIQNNVIHSSYTHGVKKLLFLGSTCIYPKEAKQPMEENELLMAPLEYTNEPYAIAKIAGIKLCESYNIQYGTNFISVMPTNLYGYFDNFDLEKSHVLPAMIRKIYLAKLFMEDKNEEILKDLQLSTESELSKTLEKYGIRKGSISLWGSGKPYREFLWSDDMADACVHIMKHVNFSDVSENKTEIRNTHINIGTGIDVSIKDLASIVAKTVGFTGEIVFDSSKPDGTMKKLTNVSKLHSLGWKHQVELNEGVQKLFQWYTDQQT